MKYVFLVIKILLLILFLIFIVIGLIFIWIISFFTNKAKNLNLKEFINTKTQSLKKYIFNNDTENITFINNREDEYRKKYLEICLDKYCKNNGIISKKVKIKLKKDLIKEILPKKILQVNSYEMDETVEKEIKKIIKKYNIYVPIADIEEKIIINKEDETIKSHEEYINTFANEEPFIQKNNYPSYDPIKSTSTLENIELMDENIEFENIHVKPLENKVTIEEKNFEEKAMYNEMPTYIEANQEEFKEEIKSEYKDITTLMKENIVLENTIFEEKHEEEPKGKSEEKTKEEKKEPFVSIVGIESNAYSVSSFCNIELSKANIEDRNYEKVLYTISRYIAQIDNFLIKNDNKLSIESKQKLKNIKEKYENLEKKIILKQTDDIEIFHEDMAQLIVDEDKKQLIDELQYLEIEDINLLQKEGVKKVEELNSYPKEKLVNIKKRFLKYKLNKLNNIGGVFKFIPFIKNKIFSNFSNSYIINRELKVMMGLITHQSYIDDKNFDHIDTTYNSLKNNILVSEENLGYINVLENNIMYNNKELLTDFNIMSGLSILKRKTCILHT